MTDTYVDVVSGEEILIQIGNGADPEVWAHDCLINGARSLSLTASTRDQTLPNCTDPSKPDKTVRDVDALDSQITGEGKVHGSSMLAWMQRVGKIIPIRVRKAGVWRVAGPYILTQFDLTGTPREFATASVTLVQADQPTIDADAG
ncbi:phage tail tube protein [uncultured Brevundimonas sp.]|uniref:phage tail tube protein n=1 Tax=uncultured Brevundimonas sp. TaxID=213418 RepID=UPI00260E986F|nr:phage tail tube protein [uncultured Brevundimonas sp.]